MSLEEADRRDWDVGVEVEDGVVSPGVLLLVAVAPMAWARVSSSLPSLSEISFPDPSFVLQWGIRVSIRTLCRHLVGLLKPMTNITPNTGGDLLPGLCNTLSSTPGAIEGALEVMVGTPITVRVALDGFTLDLLIQRGLAHHCWLALLMFSAQIYRFCHRMPPNATADAVAVDALAVDAYPFSGQTSRFAHEHITHLSRVTSITSSP